MAEPTPPDRDLPDHLDVDVASMVEILAQRFHENPLAGLREAVQNAVDAVRPADDPPRIEVDVTEGRVEVWDNGEGMGPEEARRRWGRVFASEKAGDAEAIGEFGVGRFALMGLGTPLVLDTHDGEEATRVTIDRSGTLAWDEGERTSRGTTVAVEGDFSDLVGEALPYVRRVAAKRPEPIVVNGEEVSGEPFAAASEGPTHGFETGLIEGALGVQADASGEVELYHRRLYVDTIHPEPGVVGEVNCDALNLVATRDGVQEDEAFEAFREALDEQVGALWAKVARGPDAERFARHLFRRAREAGETGLVERVPVERIDGRREPWEEVVEEAREAGRAVTYFSGRPGGVVQEAVERGVCVAVRVGSRDARLALHRDAEERGLESIYREDALRRRLEEAAGEATVVEGGGSAALAEAARDLLSSEVKNLEVLFVRGSGRRADLTGNVLELDVEDDLVERAREVADEDRHLAQALLAPAAARELARRDLDRDRHDVHDERFASREEDVRDRLLARVARERLDGRDE